MVLTRGASLCLGVVEIPALVFLDHRAQLADWCEKEAMLWFCLKSPSRITFLIASSYKVQYSVSTRQTVVAGLSGKLRFP